MIQKGDTVRLMCPVSGAFRGLVRVKEIHPNGLCTVWAETPILDWLSTGDDGEYPYRMPYEAGESFNAETEELTSAAPPATTEEPDDPIPYIPPMTSRRINLEIREIRPGTPGFYPEDVEDAEALGYDLAAQPATTEGRQTGTGGVE